MAKEEDGEIRAAKDKLNELRGSERELTRQLGVIVREQNLLRLADAEACRIPPNVNANARKYAEQVRRKNVELSRRKIETELDRIRSSIPIQEATLQNLATKHGHALSEDREEEMHMKHNAALQQAMLRGR